MSALDLLQSMEIPVEHGGLSYGGLSLWELQREGVPASAILSGLQMALKVAVDTKAEVLRSSITTPGTGQAMEYQESQSQAAAALKAPSSATAAKYPMLAASIGIDIDPSTGSAAEDVLGVARAVMASYDQWLQIGAAIKQIRLTAKRAIDEALSPEAAAETYGAIAWPSLG